MNFRNISAWSIRNPVVPIVLFIGLTLAGIVAFMGMKVQSDPDIEFPVVIIMVSQPGAAPTEIETQVTQKIESAVRTISGVDTLSSSATEGRSQTMVMFQLGTDINESVNEVKNAIDQIRGDLPDGILEPSVFKAETSSDPIAYYAVSTDDMTLEQLSWLIDDTIAKRLLAVPGTAAVDRNGGVNREIRVELDPQRMQALGVTASQINATLRQVNVNAAGGRAEVAGSRQSVRVLGNARSAFELSQSDVSLTGGRTVKLADVARVSDSFSELTSLTKVRGKTVVTFSITRARGESDVSVYDGAVAEMAKIQKENGNRIHFTRLFTSVDYTKSQYESSIASIIEGAVLAVIVVFFFLRDWRATFVSALAIPLSAVPTFWFVDMLGITLNSMSLLALGLVAGVLVDDAIVEIENIVRHMRMGKSAYQAAIDAADEIGLAVVATTFSIVAVFLPVGLMGGIAGRFFQNFGLTVVVAVLISLLVARMITPMVAAYFLKAHGEASHGEGPAMDRYMRLLTWSLDTRDAEAYRQLHRVPGGKRDGRPGFARRLAARLRDHRVWMLGAGLFALMMTVLLLFTTPQEFFPNANSDFSRVAIEMVPGTTIAQTEKVADAVARIIEKEPDVQEALERVNEGKANIFITLKPDRKRTSIEFERELTPVLQKVADARVNFLSQTQGGQGGTGRALTVMLSGSDTALLERTAATVIDQMNGLNQVVAPRISADMRRPEIIIKPRLDLAAQLGVSTQALSQTIRIATQGEIDQNSAKFSLSDRQVPIRVMLPVDSRRDIETLRKLPVPAASGTVPLERVAEITFGSGPTTIQRYNQSRRVLIGADLAPNVPKGTADKAIAALPIMKHLPPGVSNAPFGSDRWEKEMVGDFLTAVISGILLVLAVLVLLYHRFISPLVNMGSLFLAPLGGLITLVLFGQTISMPVYIGILMLFGIVAKNSILLIDFAIEEMARGTDKRTAIMEAGHKRAQPIVMTTVAMVAGMIPTALSLGGDGAWRAPMGTVVIGGLILSTLLTLLIVPAGFSLADGLEKRIGPKLRRGLLTFEPGEADAAGAPGMANTLGPGTVPAE